MRHGDITQINRKHRLWHHRPRGMYKYLHHHKQSQCNHYGAHKAQAIAEPAIATGHELESDRRQPGHQVMAFLVLTGLSDAVDAHKFAWAGRHSPRIRQIERYFVVSMCLSSTCTAALKRSSSPRQLHRAVRPPAQAGLGQSRAIGDEHDRTLECAMPEQLPLAENRGFRSPSALSVRRFYFYIHGALMARYNRPEFIRSARRGAGADASHSQLAPVSTVCRVSLISPLYRV